MLSERSFLEKAQERFWFSRGLDSLLELEGKNILDFHSTPTPFCFFVSTMASAIFSALDVSVDIRYQPALHFSIHKRGSNDIQSETKPPQPHDVLPTKQVSSFPSDLHKEAVLSHTVLVLVLCGCKKALLILWSHHNGLKRTPWLQRKSFV